MHTLYINMERCWVQYKMLGKWYCTRCSRVQYHYRKCDRISCCTSYKCHICFTILYIQCIFTIFIVVYNHNWYSRWIQSMNRSSQSFCTTLNNAEIPQTMQWNFILHKNQCIINIFAWSHVFLRHNDKYDIIMAFN